MFYCLENSKEEAERILEAWRINNINLNTLTFFVSIFMGFREKSRVKELIFFWLRL
jgi:deoxyribodipyrimidine photolyase-like uncharacterized protein